jgi:hypothetical protein
MCGGKKKKRKKMINNGTLIRSTAIAANVRPALRRQGLGFQMLNIRTMPNSSAGEFITTAQLLQNRCYRQVWVN